MVRRYEYNTYYVSFNKLHFHGLFSITLLCVYGFLLLWFLEILSKKKHLGIEGLNNWIMLHYMAKGMRKPDHWTYHSKTMGTFSTMAMETCPFIPKVFSRVASMFSWALLPAQGNCHAGTDLGLLISVKGYPNTTAYKDILYTVIMFSTLWPQCGEE